MYYRMLGIGIRNFLFDIASLFGLYVYIYFKRNASGAYMRRREKSHRVFRC